MSACEGKAGSYIKYGNSSMSRHLAACGDCKLTCTRWPNPVSDPGGVASGAVGKEPSVNIEAVSASEFYGSRTR